MPVSVCILGIKWYIRVTNEEVLKYHNILESILTELRAAGQDMGGTYIPKHIFYCQLAKA